jgi:NADPH:quinone reductase-like Zn-dependent oxidoreductase
MSSQAWRAGLAIKANMRAWQIGETPGTSALAVRDLPDPSPGESGVVVRTRAVSLNYRDLLVVTGRYQKRIPVGAIPCSDAAGDVVAIGPAVSRVRVGDRVTSSFAPAWQRGAFSRAAARSTLGAGENPGVLAERFMLPEDAVVPIPTGLSFEQASTLPCAALTAWHALFEETPIGRGATVLTLGTGGVSIFAVQFALKAGATVIGTSGSAEKLARLSALGASHTIHSREQPLWGDNARELAGGEGVDQVIEVGGQGTLEQSLRAVRFGGTISLIGTLAEPSPINLVPVLMRNIRLQGVMTGSREMFDRMNQGIERWNIQPVIDRTFPFDEAPLAFEYLASGAHLGKIVIGAGAGT